MRAYSGKAAARAAGMPTRQMRSISGIAPGCNVRPKTSASQSSTSGGIARSPATKTACTSATPSGLRDA
jgi:hypothetical protein